MVGSPSEKKITLVDFFAMIEESVTLKKILFRQNQLSNMVDHQNKTRYPELFNDSNKKHQNSKAKTSYGTRRFSIGTLSRKR
jgi:hypothetical protein